MYRFIRKMTLLRNQHQTSGYAGKNGNRIAWFLPANRDSLGAQQTLNMVNRRSYSACTAWTQSSIMIRPCRSAILEIESIWHGHPAKLTGRIARVRSMALVSTNMGSMFRVMGLKSTRTNVTPEPVLAKKFEQRFGQYISIDLDGERAMEAMDVTALAFADRCFDAIVCNHVLEHVLDDRTAIAELYRLLKPGGWGSIQVPMRGDVTHEDPGVTDPQERRRRYGQDDHVRQYGSDFMDRLRDAGFEVLILSKQGLLDPEMLERVSVACENEVVLVTKPL